MKIKLATRRKARIEMLPLIDIVFLLLVVFIYAMLSMTVHKGLPVQLPNSSTAKLEKNGEISITVQKRGDNTALFVDKEQVELTNLSAVLAARGQSINAPEKQVLLFADNTISYENLFKVLDEIRKAGISQISLQAEERTGP